MPGPIERHINAFGRLVILVLGLVFVGMGVYGLIDFDRREAVVGNLLWIIAIVAGVFVVRIARPINLFWTDDDNYRRQVEPEQSPKQKSLWRLVKILTITLLVSLALTLIGSRLSSGEGSAGESLFDVFGTLALAVMVAICIVWHFFIDQDSK